MVAELQSGYVTTARFRKTGHLSDYLIFPVRIPATLRGFIVFCFFIVYVCFTVEETQEWLEESDSDEEGDDVEGAEGGEEEEEEDSDEESEDDEGNYAKRSEKNTWIGSCLGCF